MKVLELNWFIFQKYNFYINKKKKNLIYIIYQFNYKFGYYKYK